MGLVRPKAFAAEPAAPQDYRLDAADPSHRRRAADALSHGTGGEDALIARLGIEEDRSVRESIFLALATLATDAAAAGLAELLGSARAELRNGALETLAAMPNEAARLLPGLGAAEDPDVRIFAIMLSGELPPSVTGGWLIAFLEDEQDPNVCAAGAEILAENGDESALPVLEDIRARFAGEPFVCFAAGAAIARIGGA